MAFTKRQFNERDVFKRMATDPVWFVQQVFGIDPTDQQKAVLNAYAKTEAHIAVKSGHGVGKTTLLAWIALHFLSFSPHECKIPCTAPSSHQLEDLLWAELRKWHNKMPDYLKNEIIIGANRMIIRNEPERYAVGRTARREKPEALQGFHGDYLLFLIDEASGIDEIIFEVAEGALSTKGAKIIMTSNPTRAEGYFYRAHTIDRQFWDCFTFSCLDSPLVTERYVEQQKRKYGEDSNVYRVRVLGEFPDGSDDCLIPLSWLEQAIGRDVEFPISQKIAGLDVARFGDDRTSLVVRQGNKVIHIEEWAKKDLMETCGRVVQAYRDQNLFHQVHVDSIGLGSGVVDRLAEMGIPVAGINVAESPAYGDRFNRLRDELWWKARDFFGERQCCIDPKLEMVNDFVGQLSSIKYSLTSAGKVKAESKEEMKKRGLQSPNIADAFCLTLAEGVRPGGRRGKREVVINRRIVV